MRTSSQQKKRFHQKIQGARTNQETQNKKYARFREKRLRGLSMQFYSGQLHQKYFVLFCSSNDHYWHSHCCCCCFMFVVLCVHVSQLKAFLCHFIIYRFVVRVGKFFAFLFSPSLSLYQTVDILLFVMFFMDTKMWFVRLLLHTTAKIPHEMHEIYVASIC